MARETTKTPRSLRIAFFGLLAILALAPLPFGSNRLWAWSFLSVFVAFLTLFWAYGVVRTPGSIRIPWRRHLPATIMFGLAIIWFMVQASGLTPAAWDHPIWAEAAAALGQEKSFGAISLDPNASFDGAMRLLAYGGVFWLAMHFGRSRRLARRILWAIVISGTVYSLYGLAVQFSGSNTILWFEKWAYGDVVTSTFVNRNSFGTYAGLVIMAAFGLLTWEADEAASLGIANRVGIVHMIDSMGARVFGLLVALFVTGSALLFSASRGGTISTAVGVMVFLIGLVLYKRERVRRTIVFAGIIMLGGAVLLSFSGRELASRLSQSDTAASGRREIWEFTRQAIDERPWLGTGLTTFRDVSVRSRGSELSPRTAPFFRAHNGYLEMILEGGYGGFLLILGSIVWLGLWTFYGIISRHQEAIYSCIGLGAIGVVGTHAWVDFSLQIPAVAVTFAALLAVACAQANRHRSESRRSR